MKKKIVTTESESWLSNYVDSFPCPPTGVTIEALNTKLQEDYRARYMYNSSTLEWQVHFDDEKDYMAMVLKWS